MCPKSYLNGVDTVFFVTFPCNRFKVLQLAFSMNHNTIYLFSVLLVWFAMQNGTND